MLQLVIPSYKKFLPLLNNFISVSSEVFEIQEIRDKIELCAEEAFIYILKNSYREEQGDIEIKIEINETHFVLSFTDKGLPIDISFPKAAAYTIDTVDAEGLELLLIHYQPTSTLLRILLLH